MRVRPLRGRSVRGAGYRISVAKHPRWSPPRRPSVGNRSKYSARSSLRRPAGANVPRSRPGGRWPGFPTGKTFDAWQPEASSIPLPTQQALRTLEWVGRRENLVVCGPSGSGKDVPARGTGPPSGRGRVEGRLVHPRGPRRADPPPPRRRHRHQSHRPRSASRPVVVDDPRSVAGGPTPRALPPLRRRLQKRTVALSSKSPSGVAHWRGPVAAAAGLVEHQRAVGLGEAAEELRRLSGDRDQSNKTQAWLRRSPARPWSRTPAGSWSAGSGRASSCGSRGRCRRPCSRRMPRGRGRRGSSWSRPGRP